jgi:hypothetical protein
VEGLRPQFAESSIGEISSSERSQLTLTFHLDPRTHRLNDKDGNKYSCMPLDRGIFHRSIRSAYPMLSAESSVVVHDTSSSEVCDQLVDNGHETNSACYQVSVTADPLFLSLAALLHEPHVDLTVLCAFYKRGYSVPEPTTAALQNISLRASSCGRSRKFPAPSESTCTTPLRPSPISAWSPQHERPRLEYGLRPMRVRNSTKPTT